jgi:hypothetical protein
VNAYAERFGVRAEVLADVCKRFALPDAGALSRYELPGDGASVSDRPSIRWIGRRTEDGAVVFRVTDSGEELPLRKRFDLRNHSPTGNVACLPMWPPAG